MSRSIRILTVGTVGLFFLAISGCGKGGSGSVNESAEADHLRHAAGMVSQYTAITKKQPGSIEEVRDWAVKEGKGKEEDFASTRDKEPYGMAIGTTGVVLYEQTGKNGKCYMMRMGAITEVSAEEAKKLAAQNPMRDASGRPKKTGK